MKKEIMEALKAKFEGVSDAILGRIAEKLAKTATTSDQVKEKVEALTWQQVIEGYGDSRATEATQTAVQGYEKKYGLKDGKPVEGGGGSSNKEGHEPTPPREPAGGGESIPEWAKALIESDKQMSERLNKMEADRITASRRKQLTEATSKLSENVRKAYERTPVGSMTNEEFTKLMGEVSDEVEAIVAESQQKGAVFGRPTSHNLSGHQGGQKEATKEEAQAVVDRLVR